MVLDNQHPCRATLSRIILSKNSIYCKFFKDNAQKIHLSQNNCQEKIAKSLFLTSCFVFRKSKFALGYCHQCESKQNEFVLLIVNPTAKRQQTDIFVVSFVKNLCDLRVEIF